MATFDYNAWSAEQAKRSANTNNGGSRELKPVHFMGEYLDKSGATAIVRFPYTSMSDVSFETVHKVMGVFPNNKYGKFVRCTGEKDCPLCNSENADVRKKVTRFYAKAVVYTIENGKVVLNAAIWDRPAAFADIDLKNLMTEYGDISNYLFKITKSGEKQDTRYTILPVMNKTIYPDEQYVKDFSCLDGIDPKVILSKSMAQYNAALNPEEASAPVATANAAAEKVVEAVEIKDDPLPESFNTPASTPVVEAPVDPTPYVAPTAPAAKPAGTGRYKF